MSAQPTVGEVEQLRSPFCPGVVAVVSGVPVAEQVRPYGQGGCIAGLVLLLTHRDLLLTHENCHAMKFILEVDNVYKYILTFFHGSLRCWKLDSAGLVQFPQECDCTYDLKRHEG